jgi:hypothetical protein
VRHAWHIDGVEDAELGISAHGGSEVLFVVVQSVEFSIGADVFLGAEGRRIITVAFGLLHLNYKTTNYCEGANYLVVCWVSINNKYDAS